jgi:O-antigen/teichoic acid export membrane protein
LRESSAAGADPTEILDTREAGSAALRGSFLRVGSYVGGLLLALLAAPLLVRYLGQEDFGRYFTVVSLIAIVAGLTEGGLNLIATREYSNLRGEERHGVMANLFGMRLVLSIFGGLLAVLFAALAGYAQVLVIGTAVAAGGMILQLSQMMLVVPLQSSLRFGWAASIELLRQVVSVGLIVSLVLAGAGLLAFLAVPIPACLAALVATALLVRHLTPLVPRFQLGTWRPLMKDAFVFAVAIAVNTLYFRVTVVIMSLGSTGLQTGYFSTSFQVVAVMIALPTLLVGSAFPILSRASAEDLPRLRSAAGRILELSVIVGAWLTLCTVLASDLIVRILGGAEALPAASVLRVQALAVLATFVTVSCGTVLVSLKLFREVLVINLIALAVAVGLSLALVPGGGAQGAAEAAVAAEFLLAAMTLIALVRADGMEKLPLGGILLVMSCAAVAFGLGWLLDSWPVLAVIVATAVYAAGLKLSGRFPPELQHALGNAAPAAVVGRLRSRS